FCKRGNHIFIDGTVLERRDERSDGALEHVSISKADYEAADHIGAIGLGQAFSTRLDSCV
ncbi:hypothetical protein, partial [Maricaulis sp.]|uniref:hypothetical protein n=1 Tax=Maricaulis sp. TaxID=1486257 RepID=UPI002637C4D8